MLTGAQKKHNLAWWQQVEFNRTPSSISVIVIAVAHYFLRTPQNALRLNKVPVYRLDHLYGVPEEIKAPSLPFVNSLFLHSNRLDQTHKNLLTHKQLFQKPTNPPNPINKMSGCGCAASGACGCGSTCTCDGCPVSFTGSRFDRVRY